MDEMLLLFAPDRLWQERRQTTVRIAASRGGVWRVTCGVYRPLSQIESLEFWCPGS